MIFVTVSFDLHPFHRLISKMDEIAEQLDEEVIIQGRIEFEAKHSTYLKCVTRLEFEELLSQARLVVSHAGIGAIIQTLEHHKPLIIVPRIKKFNEHHNDHQFEIARQLQNRKGIKVVYNVYELEDLLDFAEPPDFNVTGRKNIIQAIKRFIDSIDR